MTVHSDHSGTFLKAHDLRLAADRAAVDLEAQAGAIIAIIGAPESYKVKWLMTLAGFRRPGDGSVQVSPRAGTATRIAYVSAEEPLLSTFTVRGNVMLPRLYHYNEHPGTAQELAERVLDRMAFAGERDRLPADLDRHDMQRALLARALVMDPCALFLHEPFDFLLATAWPEIAELILSLAHDDRRIVVLATQNLLFVQAHADRILFVDEDRVRVFDDWESFSTKAVHYLQQLPLSMQGRP